MMESSSYNDQPSVDKKKEEVDLFWNEEDGSFSEDDDIDIAWEDYLDNKGGGF